MLAILLVVLAFLSMLAVQTSVKAADAVAESGLAPKITVVYDNNKHDNRLKTEWGFSAWMRSNPSLSWVITRNEFTTPYTIERLQ